MIKSIRVYIIQKGWNDSPNMIKLKNKQKEYEKEISILLRSGEIVINKVRRIENKMKKIKTEIEIQRIKDMNR